MSLGLFESFRFNLAASCQKLWAGISISSVRSVAVLPAMAVLLTGIMVTWFPRSALSEDRFALLIGNSAYQGTGRLANPGRDVDALRDTLTSLSFNVSVVKDVNIDRFDNALNDFQKRLTRHSIALFFFAGHGIEIDGQNYLLPLNHGIQSKREVQRKCVNVQRIVEMLEESRANLRILILDACRSNPFNESLGRNIAAPRFTAIVPPEGTIIAFSTEPGEEALDGGGKNSPFTQSLCFGFNSAIQKPLEIQRIFRIVGQECKRICGQRPYIEADQSMPDYRLGRPQQLVAANAASDAIMQDEDLAALLKPKVPTQPKLQDPALREIIKREGRFGVFVISTLRYPVIVNVFPDSPAARALVSGNDKLSAKIKPGDRIVKINGSKVRSAIDVSRLIKSSPLQISLEIQRTNGQHDSVVAELRGEASSDEEPDVLPTPGIAIREIGFTGLQISDHPDAKALRIDGVTVNSIAHKIHADTLPGMPQQQIPVSQCVRITHINQYRVRTLADADRVITKVFGQQARQGNKKILYLNLLNSKGQEVVCYFSGTFR